MDKYDKAIAYLTEFPGSIVEAWNHPLDHPAGCLFEYAGKDYRGGCGCLTQIHKWGHTGRYICPESNEITQAIIDDKRLPDEPVDITVKMLPVFAEWQRRLDACLPSRKTK